MRDSRDLNRGLIAVLVGGALLAAALVIAVEVTGFGDRERDWGEVVATVDGAPITWLDWQVALWAGDEMRTYLRDSYEAGRTDLSDVLDWYERSPREVVALSSLVTSMVSLEEARARGCTASEADVQAVVDEGHDHLSLGLPPSAGDAAFDRLIEKIGIERHESLWAGRHRRSLITNQLAQELFDEGGDASIPLLQYRLALEAEVRVMPAFHDQVTAAEVFELIDKAYRGLQSGTR